MIPCTSDPSFISDRTAVLRQAAVRCITCPAFDVCDELGTGEEHGVYAGKIHTDPARVAFRAENRASFNAGRTCRNGHDLGTADEPSENRVPLPEGVMPWESNLPRVGCRRCTDLRDELDRVRRTGRADYFDLVPA